MTAKLKDLEIIAICSFFVLLCAIGIVWSVTSGLLTSGIDGIMLLFVCLMMAGILGLIILLGLKDAGLIPTFGHSKSKAAAPAAKSAPQTSQPAPQGK